TSDDGHTWALELSSGATAIVANGRAALTLTAGTSHEAREITNNGGPWNNADWTMTTRVRLIRGTAGGASFIGITTDGSMWLELNAASSLFGAPGGPSVSWTFTSGSWYRIRWEVTGWVGTSMSWRARIWADGDPEPSTWQISSSGGGGTNDPATTHMFVYCQNLSAVSAFQVAIDYINFDYAGKACYRICESGHDFDNFNRIVSGAWDGPWSTDDLTDASVEVDGSVGVANIDSGGDAVFIGSG